MALATHGSLGDLVQNVTTESARDGGQQLGGITLQSFILKDVSEGWFNKEAEVYIIGVAADAAGVKIIPLGQEQLQADHLKLIKEVKKGENVVYLGAGLPLVVPPTKDFLAMRLLVVDSDAGVRKAADVIKAVADTVGAKETATLLALTGQPHAAAVAVVFGKVLETAVVIMKANDDDLIEAFEGYFTPTHLVPGNRLEVDAKKITAVFEFV